MKPFFIHHQACPPIAMSILNIYKKALKTLSKVLANVLFTFLGAIGSFLLVIYAILCSPIFLHRWILAKFIAPRYSPAIGKVVTSKGHFMATEFLPESKSCCGKVVLPHPRCAIVCNVYCEGSVTLEEIAEAITNGWLLAKNSDSTPKYPEFQQYLELWNGFMFWKQDTSFSLENHLHVHKIPEHVNKEDCETILCSLVENLLNKRFTPHHSPWEVHLLQNFRDSGSNPDNDVNQGTDVRTVILFRVHHGMMDGFSIMQALVEGLLGAQLASIGMPTPTFQKVDASLKTLFKKWVYVPWKVVRDLGYYACLSFRYVSPSSTPWHVPDNKKKWRHLYKRLKLIPIAKIKFIKNQFGVSFTGVLLSCLVTAATTNFKRKGFLEKITFPVFTVLPLPGHPDKLRNHSAGVFVELSTFPKLDCVKRLQKTEEIFSRARSTHVPCMSWLFSCLLSAPLAHMAKHLCRNDIVPAAISNFPGPMLPVDILGKRILGIDFCSGGQVGVNGVSFYVESYHGNVRIAVVVEQGVMNQSELQEIVEVVERELEILYERAVETEKLRNSGIGQNYKKSVTDAKNFQENIV